MMRLPTVKFVPGLMGAIAAFIALKLVFWADSLLFELLVFLGAYALVAFIVDLAMVRYGTEED